MSGESSFKLFPAHQDIGRVNNRNNATEKQEEIAGSSEKLLGNSLLAEVVCQRREIGVDGRSLSKDVARHETEENV